MEDHSMYLDCKVYRVVFDYSFNKLVFEFVGSGQRNKTIFTDTLYYTGTEGFIGKNVKDIYELGESVFDNQKKVEIFQKLSRKIGLTESQLVSFIKSESYRFFEITTNGPVAFIIAKDMEYIPSSKKVAS